jgi:hypothetical protein
MTRIEGMRVTGGFVMGRGFSARQFVISNAGHYWMWWRAFHFWWRFLEPILRRRRGLGMSQSLFVDFQPSGVM